MLDTDASQPVCVMDGTITTYIVLRHSYLGTDVLGIEPGHADSRSVLHSFAVTEHYVVLVMTPAAIKPMKLLVNALTPTLAA